MCIRDSLDTNILRPSHDPSDHLTFAFPYRWDPKQPDQMLHVQMVDASKSNFATDLNCHGTVCLCTSPLDD